MFFKSQTTLWSKELTHDKSKNTTKEEDEEAITTSLVATMGVWSPGTFKFYFVFSLSLPNSFKYILYAGKQINKQTLVHFLPFLQLNKKKIAIERHDDEVGLLILSRKWRPYVRQGRKVSRSRLPSRHLRVSLGAGGAAQYGMAHCRNGLSKKTYI